MAMISALASKVSLWHDLNLGRVNLFTAVIEENA